MAAGAVTSTTITEMIAMDTTAMDAAKRELLAHYEQREPTYWVQFDAAHQPGGDGPAEDDENGDICFAVRTAELWQGWYPVRVHVRPDLDPAEAVRLLHKIANWIDARGLPFDPPGEHIGSWLNTRIFPWAVATPSTGRPEAF